MSDSDLAFVRDTANAKVCGYVVPVEESGWTVFSRVTVGRVSYNCYGTDQLYDTYDAAYDAARALSLSLLSGRIY